MRYAVIILLLLASCLPHAAFGKHSTIEIQCEAAWDGLTDCVYLAEKICHENYIVLHETTGSLIIRCNKPR
jgi:hypothetical protein